MYCNDQRRFKSTITEKESKESGQDEIKALSKEQSLHKCRHVHKILLDCINSSNGGLCYEETKSFWNCYREARKTPTLQVNWKKIFGSWN